MRVRTETGWVEFSADQVRYCLAANYGREGAAVIEHNAFMNRHYPLPTKEETTDASKSSE